MLTTYCFPCLIALLENGMDKESSNPSWKLSFPHVLVATISSFLFGYHLGLVFSPFAISSFGFSALIENLVRTSILVYFLILFRVVNEPLESISEDLGFSGNTLAEGDRELQPHPYTLLN